MNGSTVIQLPQATLRGTGARATMRHLWGIVVRATGHDRATGSHYSAGFASRAQRQRLLASRDRRRPRSGRPGMPPRRTLERLAECIPPDRLLMVLLKREVHEFRSELEGVGAEHVVQPSWRGSAAEVFLATTRIAREDPHATIALLPWEHLAGREGTFMRYISRAAAAVDRRPDLAVVIGTPGCRGAAPAAWIEPGAPVERLEGFGIRSVTRFIRFAPAAQHPALLEAGALIATRVIVAKVPALLALGRSRLPDVLETLEPLEDAASSHERELLCEAVYECMPLADLDSALPPRGDGFAVLPIPEFVELERPWRVPLAS